MKRSWTSLGVKTSGESPSFCGFESLVLRQDGTWCKRKHLIHIEECRKSSLGLLEVLELQAEFLSADQGGCEAWSYMFLASTFFRYHLLKCTGWTPEQELALALHVIRTRTRLSASKQHLNLELTSLHHRLTGWRMSHSAEPLKTVFDYSFKTVFHMWPARGPRRGHAFSLSGLGDG